MVKLTTITPYWNRPQMLAKWLTCVQCASHPDVSHLLLISGGEKIPTLPENFRSVRFEAPRKDQVPLSIGYYHNCGAELANTEWIMKLDVDAMPNESYFEVLMGILRTAGEREWFNGGMFCINKDASEGRLNGPLTRSTYDYMIRHLLVSTGECGHKLPSATNFICRKKDYLEMGGCDPRFRGWGWEDYQQIYMLEKFQIGADPLPGPITFGTVTQRCRDEISRPKARELYHRSSLLALLHHWHPRDKDAIYRNAPQSEANRKILFDYVNETRRTLSAQHGPGRKVHPGNSPQDGHDRAGSDRKNSVLAA